MSSKCSCLSPDGPGAVSGAMRTQGMVGWGTWTFSSLAHFCFRPPHVTTAPCALARLAYLILCGARTSRDFTTRNEVSCQAFSLRSTGRRYATRKPLHGFAYGSRCCLLPLLDFADSKSSSGSKPLPPTVPGQIIFFTFFQIFFIFWAAPKIIKNRTYQILPKSQKSEPWMPKARFSNHFG